MEKERLDRASVRRQHCPVGMGHATDRLEWSSTVDSMLGYKPGTFPRTLQTWEELFTRTIVIWNPGCSRNISKKTCPTTWNTVRGEKTAVIFGWRDMGAGWPAR